MVNSSSATLMWNPAKSNFTSYKASLSNSTFINKFSIPGALTDFSVTDLTAGGVYNFTLRRLRGHIEGASAFIEIVTGLYGFLVSVLGGERSLLITVHFKLRASHLVEHWNFKRM